jgi:hypothetical protein
MFWGWVLSHSNQRAFLHSLSGTLIHFMELWGKLSRGLQFLCTEGSGPILSLCLPSIAAYFPWGRELLLALVRGGRTSSAPTCLVSVWSAFSPEVVSGD